MAQQPPNQQKPRFGSLQEILETAGRSGQPAVDSADDLFRDLQGGDRRPGRTADADGSVLDEPYMDGGRNQLDDEDARDAPEPGKDGTGGEVADARVRLIDREQAMTVMAATKLFKNPEAFYGEINGRLSSQEPEGDYLVRIQAQARMAAFITGNPTRIYKRAWSILYDNAAPDIRMEMDAILHLAVTELMAKDAGSTSEADADADAHVVAHVVDDENPDPRPGDPGKAEGPDGRRDPEG